jgi:peroxiredoxin
MLSEGDAAPDLELQGVHEAQTETYRLSDAVGEGRAVLLLFYPADFSPICTAELCSIRNAEWFEFTEGLSVWAVSGDSTYAHRAFGREYDLNFPLLTDQNGNASEAYGVLYDEWEGNHRVPKRSVFLVDGGQRIRYAWQSDDAYVQPDFSPVCAAVERLFSLDDGPDPVADCEVSYDSPLESPLEGPDE